MRTHRAKTAHLPAEYIPPTFWLVPPPPFAQVDGGGCYREKFFLIFYFFVSPIRFLLVFYFFIFSKHCFNSSSFHSVFLISFYLFSFYTRLITIWSLLHIVENNGFDMILDYDSDFASDLRLVFTRIKLCRFYALTIQILITLTLLLVINKHIC